MALDANGLAGFYCIHMHCLSPVYFLLFVPTGIIEGSWVLFNILYLLGLWGPIKLLFDYVCVLFCCTDNWLGVWIRLVLMLALPHFVS